ncbi:MAG: transposase [Janthinobacterium lividum]
MRYKGYRASQKLYYYGYKLHAVCSAKGVFQSLDITPASIHDLHYQRGITIRFDNCTLLGDKAGDFAETDHLIPVETAPP